VAFVVYAVPPYLGLDPSRARLQPMPDSPHFYPLLVTHIFLGSVAILTACLQVWPWLRRTHPAVHRRTGRVYVAAVLLASICVAILAPMTVHGLNSQVANTVLAVLWFTTTAAGFRAARQRRFADHRVWMLRSFALTFSIVVNRVWLMLAFALFVPNVFSGADVDEATLFQAVGVASWTSWVVNLLIVEWWIHRPKRGLSSNRRGVVAGRQREIADLSLR
jgi:uncharacterized membrane protein YozB (DUF420 family)